MDGYCQRVTEAHPEAFPVSGAVEVFLLPGSVRVKDREGYVQEW